MSAATVVRPPRLRTSVPYKHRKLSLSLLPIKPIAFSNIVHRLANMNGWDPHALVETMPENLGMPGISVWEKGALGLVILSCMASSAGQGCRPSMRSTSSLLPSCCSSAAWRAQVQQAMYQKCRVCMVIPDCPCGGCLKQKQLATRAFWRCKPSINLHSHHIPRQLSVNWGLGSGSDCKLKEPEGCLLQQAPIWAYRDDQQEPPPDMHVHGTACSADKSCEPVLSCPTHVYLEALSMQHADEC